jgi:hypothetical protein
MEYSFEISRLRDSIIKNLNTRTGTGTTTGPFLIDLNVNVKYNLSPEVYYNCILKELYYELLNDNLKLNVTNFSIFLKFWNFQNENIKYSCWITKISDAEKNKLNYVKIPELPDVPEKKCNFCCF